MESVYIDLMCYGSNKLDISILCDVAQPEWDGDPLQGNPPTYQQVTQTTNHLTQVCNKHV